MQTGLILVYLCIPVISEGCCAENQLSSGKGVTKLIAAGDLLQNATALHYRAVEGEIFRVPCLTCPRESKVGARECKTGNRSSSFNCGENFIAEARHSGNYACDTGGCRVHLQVLNRDSLGCFQPEENSVMLLQGAGGKIPCPGYSCSNDTNMSSTVWYKKDQPVSEQHRQFCVESGRLHLCTVYEEDEGSYFCERKMVESGITWTLRMAVNVTALESFTATKPPNVVDPENNTVKEVELDQSYTLRCRVYFPIEKNILRDVMWFMNFEGKTDDVIHLQTEEAQVKKVKREIEVIQTAIINQVTAEHLRQTFTCTASNRVGNTSVTIRLKKKVKVKWPSLVGYPFLALLLVTGVGVTLHVKWLELQLLYRSHFQHGKYDGDEKEFDVFLSFVWSPPSEDVEEDGTFSGLDNNEEACVSSMLNTQKGNRTQTPLEVLLPQVLEQQWGYRLFLLERDVLPGGAFTNDVVLAIQRSRMLVCLLSVDYLCDSDAVFTLESGIQALLQNSAPKLLLIWINRASTCVTETEPPIPTVVQRALKVLPSLEWPSEPSREDTSSFLRTLRKALPDHNHHSWFLA